MVTPTPVTTGPSPVLYVLDTNVFVEPHKRFYAFPICPGYWKCLPHHFAAGRIISIDKVRDEISPGDPLHDWVHGTCPGDLFDSTATAAIIAQYSQIMTWANAEPQYLPAARATFASAADGWLVAYAKVSGRTVVTHEEYAPHSKTNIKVPNACKKFDVPYVNTFEMLKDLGAAFDWGG